MTQSGLGAKPRLTIHVVDSCSKRRAELHGVAHSLGHHAEIYNDVDDLAAYRPRSGIILLSDLQDGVDASGVIEGLLRNEIWLPVILVGSGTEPSQIVAGIKSGALDYLDLPITPAALARCLANVEAEAAKVSASQRNIIEARSRISCLSPRESEVLSLVSQGNTNKIIARILNISPRTVEIHRSNLMAKLGARHTIEAVKIKMNSNLSRAGHFALPS